MDVNALIKKYYLKFAIPLVVVALVIESAFMPDTYLGRKLA